MESSDSHKQIPNENSSSTSNQTTENQKSVPFQRKPSVRRKIPEVKQTKTSYARMLKANPLLKYEKSDVEDFNFPKFSNNSETNQPSTGNKIPKREETKRPLQRTQSLHGYPRFGAAPDIFKKPLASGRPTLISGCLPGASNGPNINKPSSSLNISTKSNVDFNSSHLRMLSSTRVKSTVKEKPREKPLTNGTTKPPMKVNEGIPKPAVTKTLYKKPIKGTKEQLNQGNNVNKHKTNNSKPTVKITINESREKKDKPAPKRPLRRSLSAQHFNRNKADKQFIPKIHYTKADRTQSLEEIPHENHTNINDFSPIAEEHRSKEPSFVFKTPSAHERRSVAFCTPYSVNRRSILRTSTPSMPTNRQLQDRLNDWLKRRGKSLSAFHHLKCFGIHHSHMKEIDEENKENVEVEIPDTSSYEDLRIELKKEEIVPSIAPEVVVKMGEDMEPVAIEALSDLLTLIKEGYPREQCEAWLGLIRDKYRKLEEQPLYWECRAAIEQLDGNISNALECYKTAIVQGAAVQNIDHSLDQLLHKFSLLNVSTMNPEDAKLSKEKEKITKEARNVFKSSIIQFAIQERKLKTKDGQDPGIKLVATPVRRSTRLSRSGYVTTPGLQICSSLKEIRDGSIHFQKNNALC